MGEISFQPNGKIRVRIFDEMDAQQVLLRLIGKLQRKRVLDDMDVMEVIEGSPNLRTEEIK